jgi:cell division septation protein DedD
MMNGQDLLSTQNVKDKDLSFEDTKLVKISRNKIGYFSAITLPLILAACGGGGGGGYNGGAVSPTPDSGSGSTDSGSTDSGSTDSGSTTAGTNANAGRYTATSDADTYIYDVSFAASGSVASASDGNVIISDFDASNDVLVLRGTGAPTSFTSGGSSNVDIASTIDGDTVISLGSDNDSTGTITLKGVSGDVTINTSSDAADAGAPKVDLSSGAVAADAAGEIFEYSVKFLNGIPVAIDGEVTITGFDAAVDKIVIKTETLPAGYGKDNLLSTSGVDVTTGIDDTRIDFGASASGESGSIVLSGVTDADLSSIDLTFSISSPAISGTRVDIDSAAITAAADNETFVYDAVASGSNVVGSDGDVTISGFSLADDKIIVLGSGITNGYDLSQFKANASQDYIVDEINNQTVIYFAPDADGNSTTLTLDGVADTDGTLNIVFGNAIGDEAAPVPEPVAEETPAEETPAEETPAEETPAEETPAEETPAEETPAEETPAEETPAEETPAEETPAEETPAEETPVASYTVVNISATEDTTVTATDAAEEFRYEVSDSGVSEEGAYTVTIDGFDAASDKLTLVLVNGSANLTTQEFDQLANVEVTSDGISGTQILFAPDSNAQSGKLVLPSIEESFDSDWTATTYTVEILADSNLV